LIQLFEEQPIHFIRDELQPQKLQKESIDQFLSLMDQKCSHGYMLTIIINNPTNSNYEILKYQNPKITIINDQGQWADWKRSNIDWNSIFNLCFPKIINLKQKLNYRNKICINFHSPKLIKSYSDQISLQTLIDLANLILNEAQQLSQGSQEMLNYMVLEKSNSSEEYAIKFVFKYMEKTEQCHQTASQLIPLIANNNHQLTIICYQINHNDPTKYFLTKNQYFQDQYGKTQWIHQVDTFIQAIPELSALIHDYINQWICIDGSNLIGLGGEMGYYAKYNLESLHQVEIVSDSKTIIDDCQLNFQNNPKVKAELVKYENLNIKSKLTQQIDQWILLINMSKGLGNLIEQVKQFQFKQILYIGCKPNYVNRDLDLLKQQYQIKHLIKFILPNGQIETIANLLPRV
jgi:tRNA/tmRNA/rRNA uracil-C5-methylase (TrmA/RlmC/RlmD family)